MIAKLIGILLFTVVGLPVMAVGLLAGVAWAGFQTGMAWADWLLKYMPMESK